MKLSDITIEYVKRAYKKTGLNPGPYNSKLIIKKGESCCPLQVLGKVKHKCWTDILNIIERQNFYSGYDNNVRYPGRDTEGYKLGQKLRRILLKNS